MAEKTMKTTVAKAAFASLFVFALAACSSSSPEAPDAEQEPAKSSELTEADVTVMDMSTDEQKFVSAEFPVQDSFAGIEKNLKLGCVTAVQAAKSQTPDWETYDTIQCMGMSAWSDESVFVGSANFTGAQLAELSDVEMLESPETFWDSSPQSNISPHV
ncbi:MAG: hypothetical protein ACTIJ6_05310 [Leucobacter sp.]